MTVPALCTMMNLWERTDKQIGIWRAEALSWERVARAARRVWGGTTYLVPPLIRPSVRTGAPSPRGRHLPDKFQFISCFHGTRCIGKPEKPAGYTENARRIVDSSGVCNPALRIPAGWRRHSAVYRISIFSYMPMDSRQLRTKSPAHRSTITGSTGTGSTTDAVRS